MIIGAPHAKMIFRSSKQTASGVINVVAREFAYVI
jgi:hypothetical protein